MGVYIKGMDKETAIRLCCKLPDLCDDDFVEVLEPHGKLVEFIEVATIEDEDSGTELINIGDVFKAYGKMLKAKPVIEAEGDDYNYERASDMRDYCKMYEPTYNPEDGSM